MSLYVTHVNIKSKNFKLWFDFRYNEYFSVFLSYNIHLPTIKNTPTFYDIGSNSRHL